MPDSVLHYCVAQSKIFKSYSFRSSPLKSQWARQLLTEQYHVAFQVLVSSMWRLGFCSDVMAALHQSGDLLIRKAQWWPVSWMFQFGLWWDDASFTLVLMPPWTSLRQYMVLVGFCVSWHLHYFTFSFFKEHRGAADSFLEGRLDIPKWNTVQSWMTASDSQKEVISHPWIVGCLKRIMSSTIVENSWIDDSMELSKVQFYMS